MNNFESSTPFDSGSGITFKLGSNLWILIAALITGLVYALGLNGPLMLDDYPNLYGMMQSGNAGTPFAELLSRFGISDSGPLGRPISMLTFAINAAVNGDNVFYWKLTNVIIHCLNGVILFLLLKILFLRVELLKTNATIIAFFVSAIWLANPAQLSTVLYTVQRMTLLSAGFGLLSLFCYVSAREQIFITEKIPRFLAALACFFLSIYSKENGILILGFIAIIELFFYNGLERLKQVVSPQQLASSKYAIALVGASFIAILYFSFANDYGQRTFTIGQRLLTESRVMLNYVYQWLIPVPSNLTFFYDDYEISTSLFSPITTLISILCLGGLLYLIYRNRNSRPLISFAIAWFLIGHSLEGSVIPLQIMFEHRNYLPSAGISILVVYLFLVLDIKSIVRDASIVAYLLFLVFLLGLRADMWNSDKDLYPHLLRYRPHSEALISTNANMLITEKRYEEAKHLLSAKVTAATLLHTAYVQCISQGSVNSEELDRVSRMTRKPINSYWTSAAVNLVNYALSDGCKIPGNAMDTLLARGAESYALPSQHYLLVLYRAHWARKMKQNDKAYALLDELTETHTNATPFFLRAEWLLDDQQTAAAIQSLANGKKRAGDEIRNYQELIDNLELRLSSG